MFDVKAILKKIIFFNFKLFLYIFLELISKIFFKTIILIQFHANNTLKPISTTILLSSHLMTIESIKVLVYTFFLVF